MPFLLAKILNFQGSTHHIGVGSFSKLKSKTSYIYCIEAIGGIIMRLDKYLKVSRLIKRRPVANEACDAGRIQVNGKVAKASLNIKVGDIIEITFGDKVVKVEVLSIEETYKKGEAKELYRVL